MALSITLREAISWQPDDGRRWSIFLAGVALAGGIAYLHLVSGLGYEFQLFFSVPVLLVTWYAGARAGLGIVGLVVVLWFVADYWLIGDSADPLPLLFNTAARLAVNLVTVWLLANLRQALIRETQLAREDPLTGLTNRREFSERGRRALAQAARQRIPFSAVFIDLDRFKEVNDRLGHKAGDAVLCSVASELQRQVRFGDIVGRLGGDEFAMLLPGMDNDGADRSIRALRQHLQSAMRDGKWPVTFSIGVASYRVAPTDLDSVLAMADSLMYEVKNANRDGILLRTCDAGSPGGA